MQSAKIIFKFLVAGVLFLATSQEASAQGLNDRWNCSSPTQNISLVVNGLPSAQDISSTKIDVYPNELFRPVMTLLFRHTIYLKQNKTYKEYLTYELSYALEPDVVVEKYIPETDTYTTDIKPAPTYTTLVSCEEVEAEIAAQ